MKNRWSVISLAFAAGCFGGLVNALAVWLFGALKITAALGVALRPALNAPFLYQRIVWGGIWGLLLLLPLKKERRVPAGISAEPGAHGGPAPRRLSLQTSQGIPGTAPRER